MTSESETILTKLNSTLSFFLFLLLNIFWLYVKFIDAYISSDFKGSVLRIKNNRLCSFWFYRRPNHFAHGGDYNNCSSHMLITTLHEYFSECNFKIDSENRLTFIYHQ